MLVILARPEPLHDYPNRRGIRPERRGSVSGPLLASVGRQYVMQNSYSDPNLLTAPQHRSRSFERPILQLVSWQKNRFVLFASLLPGIRELRAPLAAGYLWLLVTWLLIHDYVPPASQAPRRIVDLYSLAEWVGKPGLFAILSFAAYVLGIFSLAATRLITRVGSRIHATRLARLSPGYWRYEQLQKDLHWIVVSRLMERFETDATFRASFLGFLAEVKNLPEPPREIRIEPLEGDFDPEEIIQLALDNPAFRLILLEEYIDFRFYIEDLEADFSNLGLRTVGTDDAVFLEDDRLRAEATFRAGLSMPLMVLSVVLALQFHWICIFGACAGAATFYLGIGSVTEADRRLASLLLAQRIASPAVERLKTADARYKTPDED